MPTLLRRVRLGFRRLGASTGLQRLVGLLLTTTLNAWMGTLNYRIWRYQASADPADESYSGKAIFIFWHEYLLLPAYLRPHCGLTILASQHEDAEIFSQIVKSAGHDTVRGSTNKGGTAALRQMLSSVRGRSLAIAPDGPRGPRRQLAQGCVYLSSRLQIPIIPIGFGFSEPIRFLKSWDQFALPRPFSRCRTVLGPRIQDPPNLNRQQIELHRQWLEERLNQLTSLAEKWAEGSVRLDQTEPLYRSSRGGTISRSRR
jgi:hypothetical protein